MNGDKVKDISAEIIKESTFAKIPELHRIVFFGDGALKCREVINRENTYFVEDYTISASSMQKPAYLAHKNHQYEDIAYFEPFYLKDFITSIPRKNIL
jgi:tRNA threonylcarbamoyladenosine biosynthesis protein TsaB